MESKPHNPSNLTPEQIGEGWRLLAVGERIRRGAEIWHGRFGWVRSFARKPVLLTDQQSRRVKVS